MVLTISIISSYILAMNRRPLARNEFTIKDNFRDIYHMLENGYKEKKAFNGGHQPAVIILTGKCIHWCFWHPIPIMIPCDNGLLKAYCVRYSQRAGVGGVGCLINILWLLADRLYVHTYNRPFMQFKIIFWFHFHKLRYAHYAHYRSSFVSLLGMQSFNAVTPIEKARERMNVW